MEVNQEEIERRREDYKELATEYSTFDGKLCKIRLNEFYSATPDNLTLLIEIHTGEIINISENGVLIEEDGEPLFISWVSIRTIELEKLDVKPRP